MSFFSLEWILKVLNKFILEQSWYLRKEIEIWDKNLYESALDHAMVDFADLAEEVMGNQNDEEDGIS